MFRRYSVLLLLLALGVATACDLGRRAEPEAGRLVIIGGGLSGGNEAVYQAILEARQGDFPLCVIPTAGATPESSMRSAAQRFNQHGGPDAATGVLLSVDNPEAADDPAIAEALRNCSGYFFTGGQQSRIVQVFRPDGRVTPALEAVLERYQQGAVISGSSAGAAIMSHPMISGGSSPAAFERGVAGRGVGISDGLGFFEGAGVDQHFLARGRFGRLLVAVLQVDEYEFGFGIDENTALVVEGDKVWTAGESGVVIVEGHNAVRDPEGNGGAGLRIFLMGPGDSYDMRTRSLELDPSKRPLSPVPGELAMPEDIFERWQFLHLLERLGRSAVTEVVASAEGYDIVIRKADGFTAVAHSAEGVQGTPSGLSVGPLIVDIRQGSGD